MEMVKNTKKKYGIEGEYLLYIGMIEPRKNLKNLVIAYHKLRLFRDDFQLVIAGPRGWGYSDLFELVDRLKLRGKIIFTDYIKEEEKASIIIGAKLFIYPSLYEGFGIPVLEAMSLGVPTISSNISSIPEISGDAALLIDTSNANILYQNIIKLLDNKILYQELKKKALEQSLKFSWSKAAKKTLNVYKQGCLENIN